jgi:hypothetical protein
LRITFRKYFCDFTYTAFPTAFLKKFLSGSTIIFHAIIIHHIFNLRQKRFIIFVKIHKRIKAFNLRIFYAKNIHIVTKAGLTKRLDSGCSANISYDGLRTEIEKSLDALGISTLDGWLLHRDDENIPVDEIVDICNVFAKEGKTKFLGVSNWRPERVAAANEWAVKNGRIPFSISQILWSAAQITKESWGDPEIGVMNAEARGEILAEMDPSIAAKLTKIMDPES